MNVEDIAVEVATLTDRIHYYINTNINKSFHLQDSLSTKFQLFVVVYSFP